MFVVIPVLQHELHVQLQHGLDFPRKNGPSLQILPTRENCPSINIPTMHKLCDKVITEFPPERKNRTAIEFPLCFWIHPGSSIISYLSVSQAKGSWPNLISDQKSLAYEDALFPDRKSLVCGVPPCQSYNRFLVTISQVVIARYNNCPH